MIGIFLGREFPQHVHAFLVLTVCFIIILVTWFFLKKERIGIVAAFSVYCALTFSFAFYMSSRTAALRSPALGEYRCFEGTIDECPRDSTKPVYLLINCYGYDSSWTKIPGELIVNAGSSRVFKPGDRIIFTGKPGSVADARNPGEFNLKAYYALSGISGRIYTKSDKDILAVSRYTGFNFKGSIVDPIRNSLRERIRKYMNGEEAELARGMLLGERMGIDKEVSDDFVNSGTIHILAVSGLHVGFITGILMALASLFRIPRRLRFFAIAPVLILYAFIIGLTPSISRAVLMAVVVLFGLFLQRRPQVLNSLGFAALVILVFNPAQLFSPGFQLSFAAVSSITFFHGRISNLVKRSFPRLEERTLTSSIVSVSILTLSATIGTVPLTAFYFNRVSLISVAANLLVVPMSGIFIAMSFTFLALSFLSGGIASIFGSASQMIAFAILKTNSVLGSFGFSSVRFTESTGTFAILYFIWLAATAGFGGNALWKKAAVGVLLGADLILFSSYFTKQSASIYVLDVGQGDSIFLQLPDGKNILVDCGMKFGNSDAGERAIVPFLERRGVRTLDYLIMTHLHSDHIGGALSVIRKIKVNCFVYPDQFSQSSTWHNLESSVRSMSIRTVVAHAGMILDSSASCRIYVLHPNRKYTGEGGYSYRTRLNDGSIVMKVCVGKESFLLVGDAEKIVERDLVRVYGKFLASDVLKVGHHGSNTSSGIEFVQMVHPTYAAISVGANNSFGHPSPEVLSELSAEGVAVWRTDSLGAAYFDADLDTVQLVDWR